jgi:hypothetical protein
MRWKNVAGNISESPPAAAVQRDEQGAPRAVADVVEVDHRGAQVRVWLRHCARMGRAPELYKIEILLGHQVATRQLGLTPLHQCVLLLNQLPRSVSLWPCLHREGRGCVAGGGGGCVVSVCLRFAM